MILSDKFIEEVQILDGVDLNSYEKSQILLQVTSLSMILKQHQQVLEIDENEADRYFRLALKLVSYFGKFKFGDRQFRQNVEFLKFKEDRKALFLQKLEANSTQLHKRLSFIESDGMPYYKNLEWRYDIQIASRGYEEEFKPRIFMKFDLEYDNSRECGKIEQVFLETDYANLKTFNRRQAIQCRNQNQPDNKNKEAGLDVMKFIKNINKNYFVKRILKFMICLSLAKPKIEVKTLDIPSFGDDNSSQQSPEFQQEVSILFSFQLQKDENYTTNPTNNTNRHLSQDSIIELKDDTVRISKAEYESLKRDAQNYQALMKLNLKLKAHNQMKNQANSYQSQIYVAQECNKKLQGHIYELLQTIKILETENQQYSEDLLLLRLQIQDQLKIIQQGKIDIERLKITMIEKDESLIELQDNYKKLFKETERTKNSKSAQRSTYVSTHTSSPLFKGLSRICLNNYCNSSFVIEKQQ